MVLTDVSKQQTSKNHNSIKVAGISTRDFAVPWGTPDLKIVPLPQSLGVCEPLYNCRFHIEIYLTVVNVHAHLNVAFSCPPVHELEIIRWLSDPAHPTTIGKATSLV